MALAIMQPYLFPYIGYWQLVKSADEFVIMEDINYIKQGFINRNTMLVNGKPHRFILELKGASQNKLINQIDVGNNREKILKTIEVSYKKAPYFTDAFPVVESIMKNSEPNLALFIGNSIERISAYLGMQTAFKYSRNIDRDRELKAQDMVIDICSRLGATHYINSIGGTELYSKETFAEHGIELSFIQTEISPYKQMSDEFVPNLSIVDIMMCNSKDQIAEMLTNYKLV